MHYVKALRGTFDLAGRSTRMELWTYVLCMHAASFAAGWVCSLGARATGAAWVGNLGFVVFLLHMLPLASLASRRACDAGFGILSPAFALAPLNLGWQMFWFEYMVDYPDNDGGEAMLGIGGGMSLLLLALLVLTCMGSRGRRHAR